MKRIIDLESLRKFNANHQLKRKLKIFIGAGLVSCLMIGTLLIWGGMAALKTVSSIGTHPGVQEKVLNLENEIQNLPTLIKVGCWTTLKSHMDVDVWLNTPIAENYNNIKSACFN